MFEITKIWQGKLSDNLKSNEFTFNREEVQTVVNILYSVNEKLDQIATFCKEERPDIAVLKIKQVLNR